MAPPLALGGALQSPTAVTNAVRRPRSQALLARNMLAAERFRAMDAADASRRRPRTPTRENNTISTVPVVTMKSTSKSFRESNPQLTSSYTSSAKSWKSRKVPETGQSHSNSKIMIEAASRRSKTRQAPKSPKSPKSRKSILPVAPQSGANPPKSDSSWIASHNDYDNPQNAFNASNPQSPKANRSRSPVKPNLTAAYPDKHKNKMFDGGNSRKDNYDDDDDDDNRSTGTTNTASSRGGASFARTRAYADQFAQSFSAPQQQQRNNNQSSDGALGVGRYVSECLFISTDLYQQECATTHKHRGDDAIYFTHMEAGNLSTDATSIFSDDDVDESQLSLPPSIRNVIKRKERGADVLEIPTPFDAPQNDDDKDDSTPYRSTKGVRFPEASNIMEIEVEAIPSSQGNHISQPLGILEDDTEEHSSNKHREESDRRDSPEPMDPSGYIATDAMNSDLRSVRLELFRQDATGIRAKPEKKLIRALETISTQDSRVEQLKNELKETKNLLERTKTDLRKTKERTSKHTKTSERNAAKLFQERMTMEEKLRGEIEENQKLIARIAKLQDESTSLKTKLFESEQETEKIRRVHSNKTGDNVLDEHDTTQSWLRKRAADRTADLKLARMASTIAELKTELVDVRTQLTEARTERLAFEQENAELRAENVGFKTEVNMLRSQVAALRSQVRTLKQRSDAVNHAGDQETEELKKELVRMKLKLIKTNTIVRTKAENEQKLEEELTETQSEAAHLREQAAKYLNEIDRTKNDATKKVAVSEQEAKALQEEISAMKQQFSRARVQSVAQAAKNVQRKQRVGHKLLATKMAAEQLRNRISHIDDLASDVESNAASLRTGLDERLSLTGSASTSALVRDVNQTTDSVIALLRRKLEISGKL